MKDGYFCEFPIVFSFLSRFIFEKRRFFGTNTDFNAYSGMDFS